MIKTLLIATVAALAIAAPAQADRGDRRDRGERADRSDRSQAGEQRVHRQRAERQRPEARQHFQRQGFERQRREVRDGFARQRLERQRPQARERFAQQAFERRRPEARERVFRERVERQRFERRRPEARERIDRQQFGGPRFNRQESRERIARQQFGGHRFNRQESRERIARQRFDRKRFDRRESRERIARQRFEGQRFDRQKSRERRWARSREAASERFSGFEHRRLAAQRAKMEERRGNRNERQRLRQFERQAERFGRNGYRGFEERNDRLHSFARQRFDDRAGRRRSWQPRFAVGERLDRSRRSSRDRFEPYAMQRYQTFYDPTPDYRYRYTYGDGYLYQVTPQTNIVSAMFPLLGGAFSVGQPLPIGYQSYNVPYAYQGLYYDTPSYQYRYGDGAIYRVDPEAQLIQSVVALLTGQSFDVGQVLPMGYDVYNVPYGYRDTYYDRDDAWYRYDDGYIYQVDPRTRIIEEMFPVGYNGYAVGYPVPAYANSSGYGAHGGFGGYGGYGVPNSYQNLYYGAPGYNYHYAHGGIYQVDPATQLVSALVALLTGQNFAVGQVLPAGYDAYNVPYQYRATYYDTADASYRYDDGYIYEIDPHSLVVQTAIPVSYGLQVGHPMPTAYTGYSVPAYYENLYYAAPGYDYRYSNGCIYQVNPDTRVVQSVAAVVTGHNLAAGQLLPAGYDVYNLPYEYRGRYHDTDDYMYRYADGRIYQVDPQTRLIQQVIDAMA